MTDNEIIKALECFKSEDCLGEQCPYFEMSGMCGKPMCSDVYDFIYRQKAEIESLKHRKTELQIRNQELQHEKSEAIKEFAEKLKKRFYLCAGRCVVDVYHIDNLVKEMAGDTK